MLGVKDEGVFIYVKESMNRLRGVGCRVKTLTEANSRAPQRVKPFPKANASVHSVKESDLDL